jgi:hypothetical protein
VIDIVANEHKNCGRIWVRTKNFTQVNISVRNSVFAYIFIKKLVSPVSSGLKCGTHIFYVWNAYLKGEVFINVWIVPFPS